MLEKEIKKLKKSLEKERAKAQEYLKGWQRAKADYVNRERKIEQERESWIKFSNSKLILEFLHLLDAFNQCLKHIPKESKDEKWVQGVIQIKRQFETFLKAQGVEKIKTVGEPFDHNYHEAVDRIPSKNFQNIVAREIQAGYKMGEHIIRAAKVIIK
ncbi:nucleotide exchange factor GrpE [Candidatus Parcubacteria bacterium 4484_255]|nr:MAG: nucleotide exchange factor GrpE [Candidatus Parcubacteria bacterium 4484_255]